MSDFEFRINKNFMSLRYKPGTATHTTTSRFTLCMFNFYFFEDEGWCTLKWFWISYQSISKSMIKISYFTEYILIYKFIVYISNVM